MSHRDISSMISELDTDLTGEISTSLATDLSLSAGEETGDNTRHKSRRSERRQPSNITKQLIERKQLLHDLQLLKIELSQKSLIIDNLKAENLTRVEELEERLADAVHTKQLLQAKLEAQINVNKEEARHQQQKLQAEVHTITERQRHLEATNAELQRRAGDARRALHNLGLSEEQYTALRQQKEDDLMLRDVIALKFYEEKHPLELKLADLQGWREALEEELRKNRDEQTRQLETLDKEQKMRSDLEVKCQRLTLELANLKSLQHQDEYKRENYDKVKSERDAFETQLDDTRKQYNYLNITYKAVAQERDNTAQELADRKQELLLLHQDKGYLGKQLNDAANKLGYTEERLITAQTDLENAKKSREELYEKYVESRDRYKLEYETRLQEELESIKLRTETEIDKLRSTMREAFERENRSLRESRDNALMEKDKAIAAERDCTTKYEQLMNDHRELQATSDARATELTSEARLKSFEADRANLIQEETQRNLKQAQVDCDKLQKKIEVLTKEYYTLQSASERKSTELEAQISELRSRLETYEKLEKELDDVVMQAAEYDQADEAERVLFSYGYGANVPSTAKRRLQHSVHLARRVLGMERLNTTLKKDLERSETKIGQLGKELSNATSLLEQAQQPYNYLIDSIKTRDQQVSKQKEHVSVLTEDIRRLKEERETLIREKNQMAADLERLLNQREQMAVMKQVVLSLSQRRQGNEAATKTTGPIIHERLTSSPSDDLRPPINRSSLGGRAGEVSTHGSRVQPPPTVFTRTDAPQWYEKLKERNTNERSQYMKTWTAAT